MAESGTCNVCSAPCTSCMHFNRLVTGVKTETLSGEAFCDNISSQHSANKSAILNPLKKHAFDKLQDTASATSSHESLSENIENKEKVRTFISEDASSRKSEKDRNEGNISNLGGSSFTLVSTKQELHGLGYAENNKRSPVISSSDASEKPGMNAELKTERDNNYIPEESLVDVSASKAISNDPAELTDVTEPSSESHSGEESEEAVEQDVNICDICGDAGREDLLAICSGCSDGAEHTYCMQEKMEKVPEGEWFCEECRLAEKIEKQHDIGGVAKVQPIGRLRSRSQNLSLKLDSKELSVDGNNIEIYTPGTQSCKRQLERVESSTGLKRQATEIAKDLSVASSPRRLSRDESFKGGGREKVNKLYQPSHVINNVSSRVQNHKGPLSKSNSFNAVSLTSKGKLIDDITHKQKAQREYSDARDGAKRLMARSMSLRPVHLGRPNAGEGEPKVIMLSPKSSQAPEMKGFRKSKEHLSHDRKKATWDERASSISGSLPSALEKNRKPTSCENGFMQRDHNSKDSKANQSDEKVATQSKLTAHATRSDLDMPEKKLNKPHGKDESTSGTWTAAKHISNADAVVNPELLPPQDASDQSVKTTDSILTWSRSGKSTAGSNLCQRCKEPITAAHVCMSSSSRLSTSDSSTVKITVDDVEKMNPVKAALHAAFLKKSIICKKRRAPDHEHFDEQPITPNSNGQNAPQDVWSGSNYMKNTISSEKKHIQKLPLNNFSYAAGQESSINNISHSSLLSKKMMLQSDAGDGKSTTKVLPSHSLPHMCTAPTSVIPLHEYIWQGDFEVNGNGDKMDNTHPGFQAHLSTFASPKVMEVVHKLSPRLSLTAIPRLSVWPSQFHETGATEDNIALYFFAKDIESYERYYKILLDNMMRNDLALKGIVSGVEILIFPSNQLPQKSQRWNMLFFMWGVFRAKKHNCKSQMAGTRNEAASGKSCVMASDASPSIPMPPCPEPPIDSKKLDCEFIRDSSSGDSSLKTISPGSCKEERVVDMECEVKPKPGFNGGIAVTDRPTMLGNKCTPVFKSYASDFQGQELQSVGPEGVNYFGKEEKEVDRVTIEGKGKKDDRDVKPRTKKRPSVKEVSAKDFEFGQSNNENCCHGDLAKISCLDSDIDICKTRLPSPVSKDIKNHCSTSDALEAGPSISSKKVMYDLNLDAEDMMEEYGTAEDFLSAVEPPRVIDFRGANSTGWDLNSSANNLQVDGDSKDRQDPGYNLTLCADTECFRPRKGAGPLFVGMGEPFEGCAGKKEEAPAACLSLSLALPFMDESKQANTSAEQQQLGYGSTQGKPPFLLFGRFADK